MQLKSIHLITRNTTQEDLEFVLHTEKKNIPMVDSWSIDQHVAAINYETMKHVILECFNTSEKVGYMILNEIDNPHGSIYLKRIVIDQKGKGYGREALQLLKKWCFEEQNAHRLYLDVKEYNKRARRLYESEGFSVEGVARECRKEEKRYISLVSMSILKSEFI